MHPDGPDTILESDRNLKNVRDNDDNVVCHGNLSAMVVTPSTTNGGSGTGSDTRPTHNYNSDKHVRGAAGELTAALKV